MDSEGSDGKRGRVRKKSAKLREMEEFEEEEKKFPKKAPESTSLVTKNKSSPSHVTVASPDPGPLLSKKWKTQSTESVHMAVPSSPSTPPKESVSPQQEEGRKGSVIKLLLNSPVQKSTPVAPGKRSRSSTSDTMDELSPIVFSSRKSTKAKKVESGDDKNVKMTTEKLAPLLIDTSIQSAAIGKEGSLKMKFILSPKDKAVAGSPEVTVTSPVIAGAGKRAATLTSPVAIGSAKRAVSVEKSQNQGLLSILKAGSLLKGGSQPCPADTDTSKSNKSRKKEPAAMSPVAAVVAAIAEKSHKRTVAKRKLDQTILKVPVSSITDVSGASDQSDMQKSSSVDDIDLSSFDFDDDDDEDDDLVIAEEMARSMKAKRPASSIRTPVKKAKVTSGRATVVSDENEFSLDESQLASSDVAELAKRVKFAAEKKMGKKTKKTKPEKEEAAKKPEKKKRPPTAYMLWCNSYRQKVVAEIPGADFIAISKRLGELWQALPEKEKLAWKNKAKKNAGKGSTLISTGKVGGSRTGPPPQVTTTPSTVPARPSGIISKPRTSADDTISAIKGFGTEPVDVAAHLKLVGESLCIIGVRLQEHRGMIAVQGSLSVLLDSMLCACGPLMCLTEQLPELNGCPREVHTRTLDNVAYFMPGL